MKTEYDMCTKEEKISYSEFVDDILINKLGLSCSNIGTKYLRELIIYIYLKNPFEIVLKREINAFIVDRNIDKSFEGIKTIIRYSIDYADISKLRENFYLIFKTEYDSYYLTAKKIIITIINMMNKNF